MINKFITFEGLDSCGKGTQIELLEKELKKQKIDYIVVREPGSTLVSNQIRAMLKDPKNKICANAELFLFQAARAQLCEDVIKPAFAAGKVVIADRFYDSTWVYQSYCRGINLLAVEFTNRLATAGIEITKTIFIDVPLDVCVARMNNRGNKDRFELEGKKLLSKVYDGYQELAKTYPNRVVKIDGNREADKVHSEVMSVVNTLI